MSSPPGRKCCSHSRSARSSGGAAGSRSKSTSTDWLALVYTAFVVLYAVIPQDWLGGEASTRGILFGLRHDLTPVAAYFLGRGDHAFASRPRARRLGDPRRRRGGRRLGARRHLHDLAPDLARLRCAGLVQRAARARLRRRALRSAGELGLQPRRRTAAAPARLDLPQPARHCVPARSSRSCSPRPGAAAAGFPRSRHSSPSACSSRTRARRSRRSWSGSPLLAYALRTWWPVAAAVVLLAAAFFFVRAYPDIAPETRFTPAELEIQRAGGQRGGDERRPARPGRIVVRKPSRQPARRDRERSSSTRTATGSATRG